MILLLMVFCQDKNTKQLHIFAILTLELSGKTKV